MSALPGRRAGLAPRSRPRASAVRDDASRRFPIPLGVRRDAGGRAVLGNVRRAFAALLSGLPLLFALAAPAAAQTVSFSSPDYPVWEGDAVKVWVVLSESRTADTAVAIRPIPLSATGFGIDFISNPSTVTIPAGHTRGAGTVRTVHDARIEGKETFRLDLVAQGLPAGVTLGTPFSTIVHIRDEDQDAGSIPQLSIARYGKYVPGQTGGFYAPVVEGTAASFSVTVSSDWAAPAPLPVSLKVSEDTGGGQDFVSSGNEGTQTMTIDPWRDGAAKIY